MVKKRWQSFLSLTLLTAVLLGGAPCAWSAEGERPTTELTLSVLSAYICNGDELSRHSAVIQPQIAVGYKGFNLVVWGNLDTRPYLAEQANYRGDRRQNWTETDVKIGYNKTFGIFKAGLTYAYYGNAAFWNSDTSGVGPDQKDDQELVLTAGLETFLAPTLTVARSFDSTQRWYLTLGLSHSVELTKRVSIALAATGSYLVSEDDNRRRINEDGTDRKADGSWNDRYNDFHDATVSLSLPVKVLDSLTVTPQVSYIFPLNNNAKYDMMFRSMQADTTFRDRQSSFLVGGVSFTYRY